METKTVSLIKAITYRIFGSLVTFLGCYIFTGKTTVSAAVSIFDFFFKIIVYYVHERVWESIKKSLALSKDNI
jgi:uncharacterized membrane protein